MKKIISFFRLKKIEWQTHSTELFQNKIIRYAHRITFIVGLLAISLIAISYHRLPSIVPLWYAKPWGMERLAMLPTLFILPLSIFAIYIINKGLMIFIIKEYLVFCQLISIITATVALLAFGTLIKIITIL